MRSFPVILLSGNARAGKDTAAEALSVRLRAQAIALADPMKRFLKNCYRLSEAQLWGDQKEVEFSLTKPWAGDIPLAWNGAFGPHAPEYTRCADPIAGALIEWHQGLKAVETPRRMMQALGTECGRRANPNLWIDYGLWLTRQLLKGGCAYTKTKGLVLGEAWQPHAVIITDGRFRNEVLAVRELGGICMRIKRPSDTQHAHQSETEQHSMPDWWFDVVINNSRDLEHYKHALHGYANTLMFPSLIQP